jgi:hypothetical protein
MNSDPDSLTRELAGGASRRKQVRVEIGVQAAVAGGHAAAADRQGDGGRSKEEEGRLSISLSPFHFRMPGQDSFFGDFS